MSAVTVPDFTCTQDAQNFGRAADVLAVFQMEAKRAFLKARYQSIGISLDDKFAIAFQVQFLNEALDARRKSISRAGSAGRVADTDTQSPLLIDTGAGSLSNISNGKPYASLPGNRAGRAEGEAPAPSDVPALEPARADSFETEIAAC